ncbi:histidine triad protein [Weissella koreensis KCTC 3621]|uniref:HIT family protein n=1 Tax=Weissella koreensis TaxID=165096 RepID=UPI00026F1897|nr:HIT family protein [Weissella koreensis]EJF34146.1 histidine triad protein [Weissella koreensis KCTC 3621]
MSNIHFEENCFYCEHNEIQKDKMSEVRKLDISTLYLNHDQTHRGRAIVALNGHVNEIFELTETERKRFFDDVSIVASILKNTFLADKVNYGIYGDMVSHLHVHLVPKYKDDIDFGDAFINNPKDLIPINEMQRSKLIENFNDALEKIK